MFISSPPFGPLLASPDVAVERIDRQAQLRAMAHRVDHGLKPALPTNGLSFGTPPSSRMRRILPA